MSTEQRVQLLIQEAEKKLNPSGFFAMFSSGPKFDEAAELFEKAANLHKVAKNWDLAADLLLRAADCSRKAKYDHDAANHFVNAANCFKKTENLDRARECLTKATTIYAEQGKFSMAAKYQKEIAEYAETSNPPDYVTAMEAYQTAADYYESENSPSSAGQCLLKVAHFSAQIGEYSKAINIYQQVATTSLSNKLLKYGVKEYFLLTIICYLCNDDSAGAKKSLDRFQDMDYTFASTREKTLCEAIIGAFESFDPVEFTNAVAEFDNIQKLDPFKIELLLRIKKSIKQEEDSTLC